MAIPELSPMKLLEEEEEGEEESVEGVEWAGRVLVGVSSCANCEVSGSIHDMCTYMYMYYNVVAFWGKRYYSCFNYYMYM